MTKVHDVLTDILGTVAKLTMSPSDTDELTLPKVIVFYLFFSFSSTIFAFWHQNRLAMPRQITYQFREITFYYKKKVSEQRLLSLPKVQ
jgi:hypothetical protein